MSDFPNLEGGKLLSAQQGLHVTFQMSSSGGGLQAVRRAGMGYKSRAVVRKDTEKVGKVVL